MKWLACFAVIGLCASCHGSPPPPVEVPVAPAPTTAPPPPPPAPPPPVDPRFSFVDERPRTVGDVLRMLHLPPETIWPIGAQSQDEFLGFVHRLNPSPNLLLLEIHYSWAGHTAEERKQLETILTMPIAGYTLRIPNDQREACTQSLAHIEAPRSLPSAPFGPTTKYGPFYLGAPNDAGFRFAWLGHEPDWAMVQPDPNVRRQALRALLDAVAASKSPEDLAKAASTSYPGAGIVWKGADKSGGGQSIGLEPAMSATDLAPILGYKHPFLRTNAGATWALVDGNGGAERAVRAGIWKVSAGGWEKPHGPASGTNPMGDKLWDVRPTDLVRSVHFWI